MPFRVALVGQGEYMRTRLAGLLRSGGFEVDLRAPGEAASLFDRRLHGYDVIIVGADMTEKLEENTVFESMLDNRAFLFLDESTQAAEKDLSFLLHPQMSAEDIIAAVNNLAFLNSNVRTTLRIKVSLPVEYRLDDKVVRSVILTLGEKGFFIATLDPPQRGVLLSARFALPGRDADIEIRGRVAYSIVCDMDRCIIPHPSSPDTRIIAVPGMGVVIEEIRHEDHTTLKSYLQRHC
jgi:hypothetical protein